LSISIYAAISILSQKRCPNCRDVLKEFVYSTVKPKQFMQEPKELPSKLEFECLVKRAEAMSQGYSISGLNLLSEESKDFLTALSDFSKKYTNEEPDFEEQREREHEPAFQQVLAHYPRIMNFDEERERILAYQQARIRALRNRAGGGAAAPVRRRQYQSDSDDDRRGS
jgi:hypothetical protein